MTDRLLFMVYMLLSMTAVSGVTCPSGRFGNNCRSQCHCSSGAPCNDVTGACYGECAAGYYGSDCQLSNIALNKPAAQSTTLYEGVASKAVDGNTSPFWGDHSCTHTSAESNPWWRVDLQAVHAIYQVKIINRMDETFGDGLHDVDIRVSNLTLPGSYRRCNHRPGIFPASDDVTCSTVVYGRYLYVSIRTRRKRNVKDTLSLCEVVVKGHRVLVTTMAVTDVRVTSATSTSLNVTWNEPLTSNGNITKYEVEYELNKRLACSAPESDDYHSQETGNGLIRYMNIVNLKKYSEYRVRVRAHTPSGAGDYAPDITGYTAVAVPDNGPDVLTFTNVSPTSFVASWTALSCTDMNGPGSYSYHVTGEQTVFGVAEQSVTINNRMPHTTYTFKVQFCNSAGCSVWKSNTVRTAEVLTHLNLDVILVIVGEAGFIFTSMVIVIVCLCRRYQKRRKRQSKNHTENVVRSATDSPNSERASDHSNQLLEESRIDEIENTLGAAMELRKMKLPAISERAKINSKSKGAPSDKPDTDVHDTRQDAPSYDYVDVDSQNITHSYIINDRQDTQQPNYYTDKDPNQLGYYNWDANKTKRGVTTDDTYDYVDYVDVDSQNITQSYITAVTVTADSEEVKNVKQNKQPSYYSGEDPKQPGYYNCDANKTDGRVNLDVNEYDSCNIPDNGDNEDQQYQLLGHRDIMDQKYQSLVQRDDVNEYLTIYSDSHADTTKESSNSEASYHKSTDGQQSHYYNADSGELVDIYNSPVTGDTQNTYYNEGQQPKIEYYNTCN